MKSKEVTGWVRASHLHPFEEEQHGFYAIVRSIIFTQLTSLLDAGDLKIVPYGQRKSRCHFLHFLAPHLEPVRNAVGASCPPQQLAGSECAPNKDSRPQVICVHKWTEIHDIKKWRIEEKLRVKTEWIDKNMNKCSKENKSQKFAFRKNNEITKSGAQLILKESTREVRKEQKDPIN